MLSALLLMFEFCMKGLKPNLDSEHGGNRTPVTPFQRNHFQKDET